MDRDQWFRELRLRDLANILDHQVIPLTGPVLELGCGDGVWTEVIRQRFSQSVAIDIRPRSRIQDVIVATCELLPFRRGHFRLVISSNLLEHVVNVDRCLRELYLATADDVVMVHTMPTTFWKVLQVLGHAPRALIGAAFGWQTSPGGPQSTHPTSGEVRPQRTLADRVMAAVVPQVHGVAGSHWREFQDFKVASWCRRFSANGFRVLSVTPLSVHSPYRFFPGRFRHVRGILEAARVASTCAYWTVKDSSQKT